MKRLLSVFLSVLTLFMLSVPSLAADNAAYANALNKLGLFRGTNNGYELENEMTREQGVVMIIRLLGKEDEALNSEAVHPFTDTKNYSWVDPYLSYAFENGITNGVSETAFGYGKTMSDAMFLTMLLRVLGFQDANDGSKDFVWDKPYDLAKRVNLSDGAQRSHFLRDDMVLLCWNALSAKRASGIDRSIAQDLILSGAISADDYLAAQASIPSAGGRSSSGYSGGNIEVTEPIEPTISLDQSLLMLSAGSSRTLTATVTGTDESVVWSSSDTAVATVSNGVVTGVANGRATITAKVGKLTRSCLVIVSPEISPDRNSTPWIPIA